VTRATVLVVEDDEDIRESLRDVFEDQGYVVRCAANGLEGLEVLRSGDPPAVVILDLLMPVMSGTELHAAMQADTRLAKIPVIVSTSDPSRAPSDVVVVRKPIDLEVMLRAVARYCRGE